MNKALIVNGLNYDWKTVIKFSKYGSDESSIILFILLYYAYITGYVHHFKTLLVPVVF